MRRPPLWLLILLLLANLGSGFAASPAPNVIETLDQLLHQAQKAKDQEEGEKAEALYRQAVDVAATLGTTHEAYQATLLELANFYDRHQRWAESLTTYERLLQSYNEIESPARIGTLEMMGDVYGHLGQLPQKMACYEEALDLQIEMMGENHPQVGNAQKRMAKVYLDAGELEKSRDLLERMLALRMNFSGASQLSAVGPLVDLGRMYKQQQAYTQAKPYYEQALALMKMGAKEYPKSLEMLMLQPLLPQLREELKEVTVAAKKQAD
jgi:tetratricopeptide (TPR) repeat protein